MTDWIEWHGQSGKPDGLNGEDWVEVELENGDFNHGIAQKFRWTPSEDVIAIVRYRKTDAPSEPEPDLGWVEWDTGGIPQWDQNKIVIAEYRNGEVSPPTRTYMLRWSKQGDIQTEIARYRFPQGEVGGPDWGAPSRELHRVYPQYYKDVSNIDYLDTYGINKLFPVNDDTGCILHARKKLLLPGVRSGGKPKLDDIKEAYDTLGRYLELEG